MGSDLMDNAQLYRQAKGQIRVRRLTLALNGLSYLVWIGSLGLNTIAALGLQAGHWRLVQAISGLIWLISLCLIVVQIFKLRRNPTLSRLLDDERTVHIRQQAFLAGYWVLLLAVAAVCVASYMFPVNFNVVLPLMLATGVTVPSFVYAWLYQE